MMGPLIAGSFFRDANLAEAALWGLIAVAFALAGLTRRLSPLPCVVATVAFALFGLSDVVETRTGAWWRPWWLLAWKAVCLLAFAWLLVRYARSRGRAARPGNARGPLPAAEEVGTPEADPDN